MEHQSSLKLKNHIYSFKWDESGYDGLLSERIQGVHQLMGMAEEQQGQVVKAEGFEKASN